MEIEWTDAEIVLDVVVGCFRLLFGILARIVISTKEPFLDWSREELSWLGHCVSDTSLASRSESILLIPIWRPPSHNRPNKELLNVTIDASKSWQSLDVVSILCSPNRYTSSPTQQLIDLLMMMMAAPKNFPPKRTSLPKELWWLVYHVARLDHHFLCFSPDSLVVFFTHQLQQQRNRSRQTAPMFTVQILGRPTFICCCFCSLEMSVEWERDGEGKKFPFFFSIH